MGVPDRPAQPPRLPGRAATQACLIRPSATAPAHILNTIPSRPPHRPAIRQTGRTGQTPRAVLDQPNIVTLLVRRHAAPVHRQPPQSESATTPPIAELPVPRTGEHAGRRAVPLRPFNHAPIRTRQIRSGAPTKRSSAPTDIDPSLPNEIVGLDPAARNPPQINRSRPQSPGDGDANPRRCRAATPTSTPRTSRRFAPPRCSTTTPAAPTPPAHTAT